MTYFTFLALFLLVPLACMLALTWRDHVLGLPLPATLRGFAPRAAVLAHVVMAVIYTTPWDNYLVATRVWWYDPEKVAGVVLGWVPIEEYLFFVLQTLLAGMCFVWLARRFPAGGGAGAAEAVSAPADSADHVAAKSDGGPAAARMPKPARAALLAGLGAGWLWAVWALAVRWPPGTYMALLWAWALPPIALQVAFGGDLLWRHRRLVLGTLVPLTLYLCLADTVALGGGTWTIDPAQSTGVLLAGRLPLEEVAFFGLTNALIAVGMTLLMATETGGAWARRLRRRPG
jgi:lycopene cyclase domain-containing protein